MNAVWQWLLGVTPGDLAGADAWTLRFVGSPGGIWPLLGLAAGLAILATLTVRSYRREGDAPARAKATLAALRLLAIGLIAALLFEPAIVLRYSRTVYSTVVVLIDDSLSMRWKDGPVQASDSRPRIDRVRQALARPGGALARLAVDHAIQVLKFSTPSPGQEAYVKPLATTSPAAARRPDAPADSTAPPPAEIVSALARLDAGGFETNIGRAVREALDRTEGRRLAALVVVSDGRSTSSEATLSLAAAAELARQKAVPLYAVAVGDPRPPKNILVAQLQAPPQARKGATATMTALVANRGLANATVTVELLRAEAGSDVWESTGAAESITLADSGPEGEGGALQEVPLRVALPEAGQYVFKARVAPRPEELDPADNEAVATVNVTDQRTAVLLVSGTGGWEFQYLRNYLLRHPEQFHVSVWQQNADADFNQEASTGMRLRALPRTPEELFKYDAVILYDPRPTPGELDDTFVTVLGDFVAAHHGGMAYVAGNKFTAAAMLESGPARSLADLLPVTIERDASPLAVRLSSGRPVAWPIQPTAAGLDHPLLQLDADRQANETLWRILPGIFWSQPVGRAKTLASVLAVSGDPGRQTSDGAPEPVIAIQYYGKGRVLYLGFDSTWRWRYVRNGFYHERFWSNALEFLAAGRFQKKRVLVTAGGTLFDAGATIRVRVEAYTRDLAPLDAPAITVRMIDLDGGEATEHRLAATRPGLFEGAVPAARTGRFEITPALGDDAPWEPEDVAPNRIEVRLPQEEFRRREADHEAMRELAGDPRRFLLLEDIDRLADRIAPDKLITVKEVPRTIWSTLLALGTVGTTLLAEWALRKVHNMA